jgi:DNA-binding response OmpR family regulator
MLQSYLTMKKILIIEDDSDIQLLLRLVFTANGYEVESSAMGSFVYGRKYNPPDLVILDRQLPDVNGSDVCHFLKSSRPDRNIPIIMISATPGAEMEAKAAGADFFLEKPFHITTMLQKVISLFNAQGAAA